MEELEAPSKLLRLTTDVRCRDATFRGPVGLPDFSSHVWWTSSWVGGPGGPFVGAVLPTLKMNLLAPRSSEVQGQRGGNDR